MSTIHVTVPLAEACTLEQVINSMQIKYATDDCPRLSMEEMNKMSAEELEAFRDGLRDCLNNRAKQRLQQSVMTNPGAPETQDEFERYVSQYQNATLHNYEGASLTRSEIYTSSSTRATNANSAKDVQFEDWKVGCGSAPEPLWWDYDVCPCDSKKLIYIDNGTIKENDYFFILPDGKISKQASTSALNIVINGQLIQKRFVAFGEEEKITGNVSKERNDLAGNLKTKIFYICDENNELSKKQEFILTT